MSSTVPEKPQQEAEISGKQHNLSAEDALPKQKKGRKLLVPSRSSSQKNQPSPTSTGLSGATAQGSRDSIGAQSKESKGSILNRHRNGTASSQHSGEVTGPTHTTRGSQPSSPTANTQKRKKTGGILSLLGCCGVPQDANAVDGTEDTPPPHKVNKLPNRPTTASHRTATPSDQIKDKPYENESHPQMSPTGTPSDSAPAKSVNTASAPGDRDFSGAGTEIDAKSKSVEPPMASGASGPVVMVDAPKETSSNSEPMAADSSADVSRDVDGDMPMPDIEGQGNDTKVTSPNSPDAFANNTVSQLPAVPTAAINQTPEPSAVAFEQPQQKFLLPPVRQEHKGKKCLVLDLDETLVHSSFKVSTVLLCSKSKLF